MLITSCVHKQAYEEVLEDGHPILIVSASDIAQMLRYNSIMGTYIDDWLISLDQNDARFQRLGATKVMSTNIH